jgi:hypothetical protein
VGAIMSMNARFVQVRPDGLAELKANPSSVAKLFDGPGYIPELNAPELQQLAQERLRQAATQSEEAAKGFAGFLDAMDPEARQIMEQGLEAQGLNVAGLKGDQGGEIYLEFIKRSLHPLSHPPVPAGSRPEDQGMVLSLEKNWHGVHYLLCGEVESGETLLGQAVLGGTEFGENLGYGPARYLGVEQVATLAREIGRADLETEMRDRFDPDAMSRLGIYPTPWSEQAIEGLLHEFRRLRDFYVGAAGSGLAIVTCIV